MWPCVGCGNWEWESGRVGSSLTILFFFFKVYFKRSKKKKKSQVTSKYVLYALYRRG